MAVLKVIEVLSDSPTSWEDATKKGVERAASTVKNVKSAYVKDMSVVIDDNNVSSYRVSLKITFSVGQ